jgi:ATP-dependent HslUV protease ATP-binding subunit HslU
MPELLGRLPLQIKLKALTRKDFEKILTGIEYNLLHQHKQLMATEGIDIEFTQDGIERICECEYLTISPNRLRIAQNHYPRLFFTFEI